MTQPTREPTTQEKLTALGFSDVYDFTIGRTCQRMYKEIALNPQLADEVFDTIREEYTPYPIEERYDVFLDKWVREQAEAVHNERAKAWAIPFGVIANLWSTDQ